MIAIADIERLTEQHGAGWGYAHVRRVLRLIEIISTDIPHDAELLTWATYLHDWGAFAVYAKEGIPHALRSKQVAEVEILPQTHFTEAQQAVILEAIEMHDYQDQRPVKSQEALILREADWLDMLGAIGLAREFAWGPNNLRVCYERVLKHRDLLQGRFTLSAAKALAADRLEQLDIMLQLIVNDAFDIL